MRIINEVQGWKEYSQGIPLYHLHTLVEIGVLVHIQTTIFDAVVYRYFVPVANDHPYKVQDSRVNRDNPISAEFAQQIV